MKTGASLARSAGHGRSGVDGERAAEMVLRDASLTKRRVLSGCISLPTNAPNALPRSVEGKDPLLRLQQEW